MTTLELKKRLRGTRAMQPVVAYLRHQRLQRAIRAFERASLPQCIILELTNVCNLRCAKCPTYQVARGRGMMDPALYEKLLADIAASGSATTLSLNGGGEAIMHPQVVEFVRQAKAVPNITHMGLTTNALALDPTMAQQLLDAGIDWFKISLDTVDAATYERMNRVDGYEQVVRNLRDLCRMKAERGSRCEVSLKVTLYKQDRELVRRIHDLWVEHVDRIKVTGLHNWAGLRGKRDGNRRTDACEYLWEQVQILWDGQVTLCCWDSMEGFYNMGNIKDIDLSHYWKRDPKLRDIRAAHLRTDFSELQLCATCNADRYFTEYMFTNPVQRRGSWVRRLWPRSTDGHGTSDRT